MGLITGGPPLAMSPALTNATISTTATTMDTALTNLSGLPSLTKPTRKAVAADQILSLDIDEILNQASATTSSSSSTSGSVTSEHVRGTTDNVPSLSGKVAVKKKTPATTAEDIRSLLTSTPTSSSAATQQPLLPISAASSVLSPLLQPAGLTTSVKIPSSRVSNGEDSENKYEDDFEVLSQELAPKKYDDDYTLSNEDLSVLAEEIPSDAVTSDSEGVNVEKPLLLASELLRTDDDIITPEEGISIGEDYNKMAETDYNKRKAEMEAEFKKKQVKPGDPDFVYDKEVNFDSPKVASGWDSGSDNEFW